MGYSYILFEDQLIGDYRKAFDAVEKYKTDNLMVGKFIDERMMELIDLLLVAQENGELVSRIVGDDMERFCKDFFSDYKISNYLHAFLHSAERIIYLIFIFSGIECITSLFNIEYAIFGQTDLTIIIFGFCIGMVFNGLSYFVIRPLKKRFPKVKEKTWAIVGLSIELVMIITTVGIITPFSIVFPSWVVLLVSGLYIIVGSSCKAWYNKKHYGSFCMPKQEKIRFWDYVTRVSYKDYALGWYKIFKDSNKKLAKKGKEPISSDFHLQRIAKNSDYKSRNILVLTTLISVTLFLLISIWTISTYDYHSLIGCIVFTAFMATVAVLCGAFCIKMNKYIRDLYNEFMADFTNSGLSYEDYMDNMERENNTQKS